MKLIDILREIKNEGATVDNGELKINVIKSTDKPDDPFLINRSMDTFKKSGVPVYYGLRPNPNNKMSDSQITATYDSVKKQKIDQNELMKLVIMTSPSGADVKYIVALPSSSGLNKRISEVLKQKYRMSDDRVLDKISKIEYKIDDMVNRERYDKADPTTRKIMDTWIRGLKKKYGEDAVLTIKKSADPSTGHPGLQSGARRLLNPTYNVGEDLPKNGKILIVDDFMIGGSSVAEIADSLVSAGIPKQNLMVYCLGIK